MEQENNNNETVETGEEKMTYLLTVVSTCTRGPEDPIEEIEVDTEDKMIAEFGRLVRKHSENLECGIVSINVVNENAF